MDITLTVRTNICIELFENISFISELLLAEKSSSLHGLVKTYQSKIG